MAVRPMDDLSAAGRQNHDGVLMLFHLIEHGILVDTMTDRPQNPGRAGKYRNKSSNVSKSWYDGGGNTMLAN